MINIKISTAQFENRSGDKEYNLSVIESLAEKAALVGSKAISFHECSVTGYTFARHLSRKEMLELAELIPDGPSVRKLIQIAARCRIVILAGLFEKDHEDKIYKAYVCVDGNGLVANDNNIIENVRATTLLGADLIFMPHVTMCTPSTRPGAGFVDPVLWEKREVDPTSLRLEFDGMKGRDWLMKWLPARAYDNGIYVVFSNPIGMDDDQLKNGCSMIIDPFGDIIAECRTLGDDLITATIAPEKLLQSGGSRYLKARRPDLYRDIIGQSHKPEQKVIWLDFDKKKSTES